VGLPPPARGGRRDVALVKGWVVLAVAVGGAAGALARDAVGRALPAHSAGFPTATLLVNASGCLLLGVLLGRLTQRSAPVWVRPLLGPGVLGGYTTFSTFAVEADLLASAGRLGLSLAYLAASVVLGIGAAAAGLRLGARRSGGTW